MASPMSSAPMPSVFHRQVAVGSLRAQTAIVRSLADALKHHAARGDATASSIREQLAEELARLGLQLSDDDDAADAWDDPPPSSR